MYFANPWGLLGLLALPAVIAIHLYHQRFPPLVVAGTHLWGAETEVRAAGRRRERLPITATLLLELLAALLLTMVLSQPRFGHVGEGFISVRMDDSVLHLSIVEVIDDGAGAFDFAVLEDDGWFQVLTLRLSGFLFRLPCGLAHGEPGLRARVSNNRFPMRHACGGRHPDDKKPGFLPSQERRDASALHIKAYFTVGFLV